MRITNVDLKLCNKFFTLRCIKRKKNDQCFSSILWSLDTINNNSRYIYQVLIMPDVIYVMFYSYTILFTSHTIYEIRTVLVQFYRWRNWALEMSRNLPSVTHWIGRWQNWNVNSNQLEHKKFMLLTKVYFCKNWIFKSCLFKYLLTMYPVNYWTVLEMDSQTTAFPRLPPSDSK